MTEPLRFLSEARLIELRRNIPANLARYSSGDFHDLAKENGWEVESRDVQVDLGALQELNGEIRTAEADIENSLIVHAALRGMTPAMACEERVWTRLTHVECLEYSRARWLYGREGDRLVSVVTTHMFAAGRTGIRDDNALSRLWWNVHIAKLIDPDDFESVLRLIVKRLDIRLNFVERIGTAARRPLARAVVRAMTSDPWIISDDETFRAFMIALNREGGGLLFEALSDTTADSLMRECAAQARASVARAAS